MWDGLRDDEQWWHANRAHDRELYFLDHPEIPLKRRDWVDAPDGYRRRRVRRRHQQQRAKDRAAYFRDYPDIPPRKWHKVEIPYAYALPPNLIPPPAPIEQVVGSPEGNRCTCRTCSSPSRRGASTGGARMTSTSRPGSPGASRPIVDLHAIAHQAAVPASTPRTSGSITSRCTCGT